MIETQIDYINTTVLPGHMFSANKLVEGKVDRVDVNELVQRYISEAMSKIDFVGASLKLDIIEEPTPTNIKVQS